MANFHVYLTLLLSAVFWNAVTVEGCSMDEARAKVVEPIWLEGPAAPAADDAISQAQCPEGYYVRRCHANQDSGDGSKINGTRTCLTLNSSNKLADLKAVVLCQPQSVLEVTSFVREVSEENEVVTCPTGSVMDSCVGVNYWSQNGVYEVNQGVNQCSWRKMSGSDVRFMVLSYTCLKAMSV